MILLTLYYIYENITIIITTLYVSYIYWFIGTGYLSKVLDNYLDWARWQNIRPFWLKKQKTYITDKFRTNFLLQLYT